MDYLKEALEFVFPTKNICLFCKEDEIFLENFLCRECRENIDIVNKEVFLDSLSIDKCFYTTVYDKYMKDIIKRFKFNDKSYLYKPLGSILASTIYEKDIGHAIDAISFVPSHRRKEAIRGYNHAELLAKFICQEFDIKVYKGLVKTKHTKDQHFLKEADRRLNLQGAFKVKRKEEIKDKRILLIDDILTSGSTIEECGRELKKNGARTVIGLALTSSRKI